MAINVKREANERAKKIKFETMVLDEMKKGENMFDRFSIFDSYWFKY
jgi:hypothetical protein